MSLSNIKSYLKLSVIWKDDDLFELSVSASNISFSGGTEIYDQSGRLSDFANRLIKFPQSEKVLFYDAGQRDGYAYFSMKYYLINPSGLVGVEICLESNESSDFRSEGKNKVKLEIMVELAAIDRFQKELSHLAKNEEGSAILYGNDNIRP